MEMLTWNILIVVSKCLFYFAFATTFGLYFWRFLFTQHAAFVLPSTRGANLISTERSSSPAGEACSKSNLFTTLAAKLLPAIVAALAALLWFFFNTGAMAEDGFSGMFDPLMLDIFWTSSVGDATVLRVLAMVGFIVLQLFTHYWLTRSASNITAKIANILSIGCLFIVSYSFTLTGHVAELSWLPKLLIVLHVSVMAWWFGLLLPLRSACLALPNDILQALMLRFGKQASILVPLLLLAGIALAYLLLGSFEALFGTPYGQVLLTKIVSVAVILTIALSNKLRIVPALSSPEGAKRLARSITIEMLVGVLLLSLCSILTSVVGPGA
jgi:putative copper resistance protein D